MGSWADGQMGSRAVADDLGRSKTKSDVSTGRLDLRRLQDFADRLKDDLELLVVPLLQLCKLPGKLLMRG